MLFMIQKQILHSFYQFFPPPLLATNAFHGSKTNITILLSKFSPPLLATNAFHDSNANITFLLSFFSPPPSWQLMLFMTQNANITFLLSKFSPPLLATNAFHGSKTNIAHSFYQNFFPLPPLGN